MEVDAGFPGGNVRVTGITGREVRVEPDLGDTEGNWFYWYFRVRDPGPGEYAFLFPRGGLIGRYGPAVSRDGGETWAWLGPEAVEEDGRGFRVRFEEDEPEVRFSVGMPYTERRFRRFVQGLPRGAFRVETLCMSRKGRRVEVLFAGREEGPFKFVVTCRHHACEATADYALEGFVEEFLSDSPAGKALRARAGLCVVPFVDKDGVEEGDQGKNRLPRDHNRDYDGRSIYPETAAIRSLVPRWTAGAGVVALDMHCPGLTGEMNENIYFTGREREEVWREVCVLSGILEKTVSGGLPFSAAHNVPFGTAWNVPENYAKGKSFTKWAEELPGAVWAAGIELPYACAGGVAVTAEGMRAFGRDLARAFHRYFEGGAGGEHGMGGD